MILKIEEQNRYQVLSVSWRRLCLTLLAGLMAVFLLAGSKSRMVYADEKHSGVAEEKDMATPREVVKYGMLPIYVRDVVEGSYEIEIDSSSNFFHINRAILTVKDEKMTVKMIMASHSYELLYPGAAKDAAAAPYSDYMLPKEDSDGNYVWQLEIEALDKAMACSAYSKNRHMWYERQILFNAGSLPEGALLVEVPDYHRIEWAMEELDKKQNGESAGGTETGNNEDGNGVGSGNDTEGSSMESGSGVESSSKVDGSNGGSTAGVENAEDPGEDPLDRPAFAQTTPMEVDMKDGEYSIEVNMTGGSGRAAISSPTLFIVKDGLAYARLLWSSSYYDYMIAGGKKYMNETKDGGNSTFTIPINRMDGTVPVIADTTAMGDPVEIEYNLTFYRDTIGEKGLIPQEAAKKVLLIALAVIVIGGIVNHIVKTRKKGK